MKSFTVYTSLSEDELHDLLQSKDPDASFLETNESIRLAVWYQDCFTRIYQMPGDWKSSESWRELEVGRMQFENLPDACPDCGSALDNQEVDKGNCVHCGFHWDGDKIWRKS